MNEFAKDITDKLAFLFDRFELLPSFDEENRDRYTFLASPRESDTFNKLKGAIEQLKRKLKVTTPKSVNRMHQFSIGDNKVTIIYLKRDEDFDFLFESLKYGTQSIIGKILKRYDLKLTHKGLFYEEKVSSGNHQSKVGEFLITDSLEKIFGLLKIDYKRFQEGFDTKEEFFDFLSQTPYLDTDVFVNPRKEHRYDAYQVFQAYLVLNPSTTKKEKLTFEDVDKYFDDIDFVNEVQKLKDLEERKRETYKKFTGKAILDYFPNFDKKKLGTSMGYFKSSFDDFGQFMDFVFEHTIDEIMGTFLEVIEPDEEKRSQLEKEIS